MRLSDAANAMNAEFHGADAEFSDVCTDTRTLAPGSVYFALQGDRFDGEAFVDEAVAKGARAVVCRKAQALPVPQLIVEDTTLALGQLAHYWRNRLAARVVAVTGSNGKTSVKGMLGNVLENVGATHITKGNLNNHIGVPLTLLAATQEDAFLVVEAGTNHPGEIAYLQKIIRPDVSVVINVHETHIEGFGSKAAIAREKAAIYNEEGVAIVNTALADYPEFACLLEDDRSWRFSATGEPAQVYASDIQRSEGGFCTFLLNIKDRSAPVTLAVPGQHQIENALAAASCAVALGVSLEQICEGLCAFTGVQGRTQFLNAPFGVVIDDSYNASPASMRAAIDLLAGYEGTVLCLGDMGELGEFAEKAHKDVGAYARQRGIHALCCTGAYADDYAEGFGVGANVFEHKDALIEFVKRQFRTQTTVLVKGSRSAGMDAVSRALTSMETDR